MRPPMKGEIQEAVWNRCAHPVQFGDGDTTCPRCNDLIDDLVRMTIPHDAYGHPLAYREEASEVNIWTRALLGMVWVVGTTVAYGYMAEALVTSWGWDDPSGFWVGGIAYFVVTLGLVMYGIQARAAAHEWEEEDW